MNQATTHPVPPGTARRVCMVTHSFYESDNRVMRYAQTLARNGDAVDVFALRRSPQLPREEWLDGVRVLRIKDRFAKTEKSKFSFLWALLRFFVAASRSVCRENRRSRYALVHVHNIPDFMVFTAWHPKRTGARVILDIHDIVPEFFADKFESTHRSLLVRALVWMEGLCAAFADHVIISNHLWFKTYTARSAPAHKCSVFINHVDASIFRPRPRAASNGKLVVLFPGGLQWHQGLDIALCAFDKLRWRLPHAEFHIYGDGSMKPELVALAAKLGISEQVRFFDPLGLQEIAEVMAQADLGVVPKRADSFGNEAYSTKIMEFMAAGVPVIAANTKVDRFYFDDSVVRFFASGDVESLAAAMHEVLVDKNLRRRLVSNATAYVARNSWKSSQKAYLELVDALVRRQHEPAQ